MRLLLTGLILTAMAGPAIAQDTTVAPDMSNAGSATSESHESHTSSSTASSSSSGFDVEIGSDASDKSSDGWNLGSGRRDDLDRLTGTWRLGLVDEGQPCDVDFKKTADRGRQYAWSRSGCPEGFFNIGGWELLGDEIVLSPIGAGEPIARFHRAGHNRWEGVRASDGARVFLAR